MKVSTLDNFSVRKLLLTRGALVGDSCSKRHPAMIKYLAGQRNDVDLFDIDRSTMQLLKGLQYIESTHYYATRFGGRGILFVAEEDSIISPFLKQCFDSTSPHGYFTRNWKPGFLHNWEHMIRSAYNFQTNIKSRRTRKKVNRYEKHLKGLEGMNYRRPKAIVLLRSMKSSSLLIKEAAETGVPIIAIADSSCNPTDIFCPIPVSSSRLSFKWHLMNLVAGITLTHRNLL